MFSHSRRDSWDVCYISVQTLVPSRENYNTKKKKLKFYMLFRTAVKLGTPLKCINNKILIRKFEETKSREIKIDKN
jgi:hypothetical protein